MRRYVDIAPNRFQFFSFSLSLGDGPILTEILSQRAFKSRKENRQKLTQLSSRSHPRHLMGKKTAQKDTIINITNDSQVNSNTHTGGHRLG